MANLKLGVTIGGNVAIHSGNYNSYAPTLTGGNASGTWAISISGNSATTSQTNFSSLTIGGAAVATQAYVTSQGYLTSYTETDPYRVTSAAVTGTTTKTLTLTRADSSTVTATWTDYDSDSNTFVNAASFNTGNGILTLTRNDGGTVTVDLDDRYALAGSYLTAESDTLATVTSRGNVATGDIYVPASTHFRARYTSNDAYHASLNWYGLQLGNNGANYIIAGRTNAGGKLMFYTNNTSDFTTINGAFAATMHASGRTSFGQDSDNGYQVQVYGSLYSSDWIRVAGSSGLYFESYGGGWRMTDSTWIRAYNDKNIYTAGNSYTGGYIEAGAWVGGSSSQTRDKLRVWSSDQYSIGMKNGYDYGHLGNDEYAMSFQMNDNSGRGFWWGDTGHSDDQGAASLTTDGRMVIAKSLSIGEGESITSPSSTPLYVKGSTSGADVFAVDGINGRLFTVTDDLSDSLFSVNTIAGLPIIEAFADNTVKIGKYGANSITISNSKIAINSDTVDANFPFYVGDRSTSANRYILANRGMGFNLADNYAQLQLYGGNGAYIDFVTSAVDSAGRIMWNGGGFIISGDTYLNNTLYTYTLYDRDDTNYYLNMNSTSRLGTVNADTLRSYGSVYTDGNFGHGLIGLYSASRYQGVFAMGDAYKLPADGTSTGTLYGIAWTHTNVGGQSKSGLGHQALFMDNGVTQTAIGSGIWTNGLITTTSYGTSSNWNTAYGWGNHASANYIVRGSTQEPGSWPEATKFKSSGDLGRNTSSDHSLQIYSDNGNDAFMAFHISGDYAVFFGLDDETNRLYTGGWSAGDAKYQIWDSRDFSSSNISNWNTAYNKRPTGVAFSGSSTKTLTLTLGDGSTLTASFNDIDTDTNTDGQTLSISGSTLTISGGNSVTLPSGGISQATADGLYQPLENQRLRTTDSVRFSNTYTSAWFRNDNSNTGLYNESTTMHLSSNENGYWDVSSTNAISSIRFYTGGHKSALRGYVYSNTSNEIGFLNNAGNWSLRTDSSRNTVLFGNLTVGQDIGYSSIFMYDSDEGTRELHCNSNRIGFLTQAGSWGAYADDSANWFATGYMQSFTSMYSPIYYDGNDSNYYLDPNSNSRLAYLRVNGTADPSYTRIVNPDGGRYVTTTSTITGAIQIKLPTQGSAMMMTCTIKVYEYSTNRSFTMVAGGHRDGANWYNEFCYMDGGDSRSTLTVRFGVAGGKDCIWIGETDSSWSYPQVFVTDVQLGYTGYDDRWLSGWNVSFVTAFETINRTQTAYQRANQNWVQAQGYLTSLPSHTHDDRYYTESESDSRFAAASHSHTWSSITSKPAASNWNSNGNSIDVVVGMLSWKNYGDGHVIFDASRSTSPTGSAVDNTNPQNNWTATYPTLMGWNGSNTYGVRVDVARYSDSTGSVAWTNVSSRPTNLSQFTNDLGNYGGWITSSGSISGNAATATSATQVVTIQDSAPGGASGKLWWESDTGKLKVYYGSSWVDATPVPDMSLYYAKAGGSITGDVTIQQTLTVVGNTLIQGVLTETSDISLKENILPLENSLDKVMKLNGVSFNKKATPNMKEIGFIAQEVEAVIPDLVTETSEGIKTVSYSRVAAVLVETIKEQQAQIDALKDMVNLLTKKLNNL